MFKSIFKKKLNKCMFCNSDDRILVDTKTVCDFNLNLLPKKIKNKLKKRKNGICNNCGLFQNFNRFNDDELNIFNSINKDNLTSESNFKNYPPSEVYTKNFQKNLFEKRLEQWKHFFSKERLKINKVLILRYWFGNIVEFVESNFTNQIYGIEISNNCRRYVLEKKINIKDINGELNGKLEINKAYDQTYDAIFCFHILSHSVNVKKTLLKIRSLLNDNGFALFSNEIERKPHNPFHNVHFSEYQLKLNLITFFEKVQRIDNCQDGQLHYVNPYTIKNDIPDYIVFK